MSCSYLHSVGLPGFATKVFSSQHSNRPRHLLSCSKPAPSLASLAASYAFGIVRKHPFVEGNKRTGLVVAFTFLELNGREVRTSEEDAYETLMSLASGKLTEKSLSQWLEKNSVPHGT